MVDAHLRSKTIETADIKNLIIGGQTGIDGIRFCLAAVTNGENLADPAFSWFLQYKNKNGQGESVGLTPVYENGLVKLPWVPNKLATQVPGRMQIQLYAAIVTGEGEAAVVDKQWVSEFAIIYIQENINPDPIVATEPSVIEYYVTLYAAYKNAAEAAAAAALVSEQAAGISEDDAAVHAAAALASKNAAGISETNAASHAAASLASKNAAGISETNAAGHAAASLASKNAAGISETNAAGHEAAALASKNAAGVSEGNASDSKLKAQKWAEEEKDVEVEPGKFSAKHWMEKASGVYDNFDARFLGYKDSDPAVDNKGNALVQGALYFNSVSKMLRLYNGTAWGDLANSAGGITYSGAGSGLEGTNVQVAIDELNSKKVKITKMPDGAMAVYAQDVFATVDGFSAYDGTLTVANGELILTPSGSGTSRAQLNITILAGKTAVLKLRRDAGTADSASILFVGTGGTQLSIKNVYVTDSPSIFVMPPIGIQAIQIQVRSGNLYPLYVDWLWIGDYSYLENSLSTEASRFANQFGNTAGVGSKASGRIVMTVSPSDGESVTIGGRVFTFKSSSIPNDGDVFIDNLASTLDRLTAIINTNSSPGGVANPYPDAHPLVYAEHSSGSNTLYLYSRSVGLLGNQITLSKSTGSFTLSGPTLTGGTDDVGAKVITQLESSYKGTPKFNGVAFPPTQIPSSNPNTLDDYEEGTFTANLYIGETPVSVVDWKTAYYTKIGNVVTVQIGIHNANKSSLTGNLTIRGLPFVTMDTTYQTNAFSIFPRDIKITTGVFGSLVPNNSIVNIYTRNTNTNVLLPINDTNIGIYAGFIFSFSYLV